MTQDQMSDILRKLIDTAIDHESDADTVLPHIIALFESCQPLEVLKAAMFAVNFDFAQQSLQAFDRAMGKQ